MAADGRSREARLLRDRERDLAEPLGGLDGLTTSERSHVATAAVLSVRLERVRSGLAAGAAGITDEDLVRLANGLARALAVLDRLVGKRTGKGSGPTPLQAHMARREAAAP